MGFVNLDSDRELRWIRSEYLIDEGFDKQVGTDQLLLRAFHRLLDLLNTNQPLLLLVE
jgi:hypothetical protein